MIYTIGHSTYDAKDFAAMSGGRYTTLIDTRTHPGSRAHPQWNRDRCRRWLPEVVGIEYTWWPEIGGWTLDQKGWAEEMLEYGVDISLYLGRDFPKQRIAAKEQPHQDPGWTNTGLRDYSFFTMTRDFLTAADALIERGKQEDVAIMCCECQWWRCHRSMIADHLLWRGVDCIHIMPHLRQKNKVKYVDGAKLVPHSSVIGDRLERYEPPVRRAWHHHVDAVPA